MDTNFTEFLNESGLSKLHSKTEKYAIGTLTAQRGEFTNKENKAANRELFAKINAAGYSATKVIGRYQEDTDDGGKVWVKENSFFVSNQKVEGDDGGELEKFLTKLGTEFNQDSVLIKNFGEPAKLVGTTSRSDSWLSKGKEYELGSGKFGKKLDSAYSKVKGRPFVFESCETSTTKVGSYGAAVLLQKLADK
jgi:hypothetical protein